MVKQEELHVEVGPDLSPGIKPIPVIKDFPRHDSLNSSIKSRKKKTCFNVFFIQEGLSEWYPGSTGIKIKQQLIHRTS